MSPRRHAWNLRQGGGTKRGVPWGQLKMRRAISRQTYTAQPRALEKRGALRYTAQNKMVMKILMVITEGDLGGAQRNVLDISRELTRRGHEVTIAVGGTFTELSDAAEADALPIPVIRLRHTFRSIKPLTDFRGLIEIFRLVRSMRPDIVHCHSSKVGVLASIAGRLAGARVVYTAHGFVFQEELPFHVKFLYQLVEKFTTLFRHKVITVSQSDADAARAKHVVVNPKKLIVIPNGIDLSLEQQMLDPVAARSVITEWCGADLLGLRIVLSIANFYPAKNLPLLVRAFEFVLPRVPEARLVLVGDGAQRAECEEIVRQNLKLTKSVFFAGKQPDAFRVLRAADVLCLSSTKEGMPYVVLEAKLAGTPIVATRVGGVSEMGEGPDMRLVVPHSAEMLSDAIVEVLRSEKLPRGHVPWTLTLRGMVDAIEVVYHDVL